MKKKKDEKTTTKTNYNDSDLPIIHKHTIQLTLTVLIDKINNDY